MNESIYFWNRKTASVEKEEVYGDGALKWAYGTRLGRSLVGSVLSKKWVSQLYGSYQDSPKSQKKIGPFIQQFKIPMEEFEEGPFPTFNQFFIRRFRAGARPFVSASSEMAAFSEARYFAFEKVTPELKIPVKGSFLSAEGLLGNSKWLQDFKNGPLLLARLCPTDYHRFHFPDSGKYLDTYSVHGLLHSVNPLALHFKQDIFVTNERQVSILETENFGKLAYVEVGALCVGKIVQTADSQQKFKRGQEKGYFLFGGSTVIVLGEPGKWKPDQDLLDQTSQGRETLVCLGDRVAKTYCNTAIG